MRTLLVAVFVVTLGFIPQAARADSSALASGPLQGSGGLACSCTNLTSETLKLDIALSDSHGFGWCPNQTASPLSHATCKLGGTAIRSCAVRRSDGKALSTRQVDCNLYSLDAAGNATAVVPVDKKTKF